MYLVYYTFRFSEEYSFSFNAIFLGEAGKKLRPWVSSNYLSVFLLLHSSSDRVQGRAMFLYQSGESSFSHNATNPQISGY